MFKPLFDVSHIKDPFWRGFAEVWTYWLIVGPILLILIILLSL